MITLFPSAVNVFLPLISESLLCGCRVVENREGEGAKVPINMVERSKQIGAALKRARLRTGKSMRHCSAHLGITTRRYSGIERGTSYITAVELEAIVDYLDIPPHEVWPQPMIDKGRRRVVVDAQPGESIEVLVNIAAEFKPGTTERADG